MKFLVFGAGAIGGYVGGTLALAGHTVCFVERPQGAETLRLEGLKLVLGTQTHHLHSVKAVTSLAEALESGRFDAAILAVKSYDTWSVIEDMRPFQDRIPAVLCLQNGVENEGRLASLLGAERVIAGTVTSAIGKPAPGVIVLERRRGIGIFSQHPLSQGLAEAFQRADILVRLYPDSLSMKWSKLFTNLPANASAAILDMPPVEIFAHPGLFRMEMDMLREALRVMRSLRLAPVDLPDVPVRALAFTVNRVPASLARLILRRVLGAGRGKKMPSFHIDLHSGRRLSEVGDLNGAVVRFGSANGVATPINQVLTDTLLRLVGNEEDPANYAGQPQKLLELAGYC